MTHNALILSERIQPGDLLEIHSSYDPTHLRPDRVLKTGKNRVVTVLSRRKLTRKDGYGSFYHWLIGYLEEGVVYYIVCGDWLDSRISGITLKHYVNTK